MEQNPAEYILSFGAFIDSPPHQNLRGLLKRFGNPQQSLRFVHIAGTNGKGSTAAMIASALTACGYRVGLFTSPHLVRFEERIRIDGRPIPRQALYEIVEKLRPEIESMGGHGAFSFFDVTTAAAFLYFAREACDVVVLEVGLGGRMDATNIIPCPLVSVITVIDYDHTDILGDTLEQIAGEKSGIIKYGGATVCYPAQPPQAYATIAAVCQAMQNELTTGDLSQVQILKNERETTQIAYKGLRFCLPFLGAGQVLNAVCAVETLFVLRTKGFSLSDASICRGLECAYIPARMEILSKEPFTILDGSHNVSGLRQLCQWLDRFAKPEELTVVMGMVKDKQYEPCIRMMAGCASLFIATQPPGPRALPASTVAAVAQNDCTQTVVMEDAWEACRCAQAHTPKSGMVVICGSLYLAGEIRAHLEDDMSKNSKELQK